MKIISNKLIALFLSAAVAVSAGAAVAICASASAAQQTVSASTQDDTIDSSVFTNRSLNLQTVTDIEGREVNPYVLFGSSLRLAHEMQLKEDGTFVIYLGATNGNDLRGTFAYNRVSGKVILTYDNGFRAAAYLACTERGNLVLKVPVTIGDTIFIVDFGI